MSKKYNKKKSAKSKPASSQTDDASSLDVEYTVPEALYYGNDNDSDEEVKCGDTDDL